MLGWWGGRGGGLTDCVKSNDEKEVGGQHQGMDRPGVRQVPEGSGEQGKMEKTAKSSVVPNRASRLRD